MSLTQFKSTNCTKGHTKNVVYLARSTNDIRIVQRQWNIALISSQRYMLNLVWRTVSSATPGTWGRMAGTSRTLSWWMVGIRMRKSTFSKFYFGKNTVCKIYNILYCQPQLLLQLQLSWKLSLALILFYPTTHPSTHPPTRRTSSWTLVSAKAG